MAEKILDAIIDYFDRPVMRALTDLLDICIVAFVAAVFIYMHKEGII